MDMRTAMLQMRRVLKKGGVCMVIIGDNVPQPGTQSVQIPIRTAQYLKLVAESVGFEMEEEIPITVSRENFAHFRNAITGNKVLIFR